MRGWMQGKVGLAVVGAASIIFLASCLISNKHKNKPYAITLPAKLPVYANGHYISMQYESYFVGGSSLTPSSGITMSWKESGVPLPFGLGFRRALRYEFQELNGSSVQYITQDTNRSIFLHAFEGIGAANPGSQTSTFWPNKGLLLVAKNAPTPVQVFWSPMDSNTGERAGDNALNFNILGECDATTCNPIAAQPIPGEALGYFVDPVTQSVSTPLGDFETYHIHYSGSLAVTNYPTLPIPVSFDYRASCLRPGQNGTVFFEGEIWIYPPIGAVKVRNYCVPSVGTAITYSAKITDTNLPF